MNCAARIVTRCPRESSISNACRSLHWLPVEQRIVFKVCLLVFKSLHGLAPLYMCDMLEPYRSVRNVRSNNYKLLCVPKNNLKYGDRAFSIAGPKEWNKLSLFLRNIDNVKSFKCGLKTHLFSLAYV